jgi:hypothetical protein
LPLNSYAVRRQSMRPCLLYIRARQKSRWSHFGFLLALLLASCGKPPNLAERASAHAGNSATDCGQLGAGQNPQPSLQCLQTALSSGRPFKVLLDPPFVDSPITTALLRTPEGELLELVQAYAVTADSRVVPRAGIQYHTWRESRVDMFPPVRMSARCIRI